MDYMVKRIKLLSKFMIVMSFTQIGWIVFYSLGDIGTYEIIMIVLNALVGAWVLVMGINNLIKYKNQ